MATVETTLNQILDVVRQLPEPQRKKLVQEIEALPKLSQIRAAARQLRGQHRLGTKLRKRLSALLAKGNAGTLTPAEKAELNDLVEEFEKKTLELAQALAETLRPVAPPRDRPVT